MERDFANEYDEWLRLTGGDSGWGTTIPTQAPYGEAVDWMPAEMAGPTDSTAITAPTTTGGGGGRNPNAGPDGSTYPNMDPPGFRGGYWMGGQWVQGSPWSGGNPNATGGGGRASFSDVMEWPTYDAPDYLDPGEFDPGPAYSFADFAYRDFRAPTGEDMAKEPGFQFRMDQGRKALEASAAGKGTLRSGGTLKDILGYGQNFASQEYGNVYNRALQEYDTNRNNAFGNYQTSRQNAWDTWNTGYLGRKDAYGFKSDNYGRRNDWNRNNAQFSFTGKQQQALSQFDDAFRRWAKEGDWIAGMAD